MTIPMLFKNHFQMGYVVRDVDRAVDNLSDNYGLKNWQVLRLSPELPCKALGFAYVKGMMIELVDMRPGTLDVYDPYIPEDPAGVRLHHMGYMAHTREEFDAIAGRYADLGIRTVIDLEMDDILYCRYFDTMARLGHYVEYVLLKPTGKDFWANVPEN